MVATVPVPVHTLVEAIRNGTVLVKPYAGNLASLQAGLPAVDPDEESREFRAQLGEIWLDGEDIAASHKFDFSGWPRTSSCLSEVLADTGSEMLKTQVAALPYPSVVFAERSCADGDTLDAVYLCREYPVDGVRIITMRLYQRLLGSLPWMFCGFWAGWAFKPGGTEWAVRWIGDLTKALNAEVLADYPDFAEQYSDAHIAFFCSALAALSSRGPEIHTVPAPARLNKQRALKGKPPIFEYRVVQIPAWARERAAGQGGSHASPRLHWRRGHDRRLGEGRKTFVHAHLVGCADNGFVHKDYAVAPSALPPSFVSGDRGD